MDKEKHNQLLQVIQAASTSESAFLQVFRGFCRTAIPRNPTLRSHLISCLQDSESIANLKAFNWYMPETLIPPLAESWRRRASNGLEGGRITNINIKDVTGTSLEMLRPDTMINDEVVEGYLELVRKSGVVISTTRLMTKVIGGTKQHPIDRAINYDYVLQQGHVFIPIHDPSRMHWAFARMVAHNRSLVVEHYDSLYTTSRPTNLESWLDERFPRTSYKIIKGQSPQQPNKYDCGLYMLMGLRLMASGSQHLSQLEADEIMPNFRGRVLAEILAGTLDPTLSDYEAFVAQDEATFDLSDVSASDSNSDVVQILSIDNVQVVSNNSDTICPNTPILIAGPDASESEPADTLGGGPSCLETSQPVALGGGNPLCLVASGNTVTKGTAISPTTRSTSVDEITSGVTGKDLNQQAGQLSLPKSPKDRSKFIEACIRSFANEHSMILALQGCISAFKTKTSTVCEAESLASMWVNLDSNDNLTNRVTNRHARIRFSSKFWREYQRIEGEGASRTSAHWEVRRIRTAMQVLLKQTDQNVYEQARNQAVRSKIWTELINCVAHLLPLGSWVAVCGSSESTTSLEGLTEQQRGTFIQGVRSRLEDPSDPALSNLQAASGLYCGLTRGSLPAHSLAIEGTVDLSLISFAEAVSLAKAPLKLALPFPY